MSPAQTRRRPVIATETIACAVCGKVVPFERSRLWWGPEGTYRTCMKGTRPHKKKEASHA